MATILLLSHLTTLKRSHDAVKQVLEKIGYDQHEWLLCVDLKVANFLLSTIWIDSLRISDLCVTSKGMKFHQAMKEMEARYQGRWGTVILADYCWTLKRDIPAADHSRRSKRSCILFKSCILNNHYLT